jgi:hypothetical protein
MKRYYTFFLFILVASFSGQAQVSLVPKAGMSMSTYKLNANWLNQTASPGIGLTAGMGVNIPYKPVPWLSLQPEVNYVQKASNFSQTHVIPQLGLTMQSEATRRNDYLEVPLLAKARIGQRAVQGFVLAGPSAGLFLSSKASLTINGQPVTFTPEMAAPRIGKAINSLEVGIQVGGGVGIAMGPGTFLLEARYGAGLTNFVRKHQIVLMGFGIEGQPDQPFFMTVPADEKSRTLLLTCGYTIPLKK